MKWLKENALKISVVVYSIVSLSLLWGYAFSGFNNILLFRIWYLLTGIIAIGLVIFASIYLFKFIQISHIKNKFKEKKEKRK